MKEKLQNSKKNEPGGPKKRIPFGGALRPVNNSDLSEGRMTTSLRVLFFNQNISDY